MNINLINIRIIMIQVKFRNVSNSCFANIGQHNKFCLNIEYFTKNHAKNIAHIEKKMPLRSPDFNQYGWCTNKWNIIGYILIFLVLLIFQLKHEKHNPYIHNPHILTSIHISIPIYFHISITIYFHTSMNPYSHPYIHESIQSSIHTYGQRFGEIGSELFNMDVSAKISSIFVRPILLYLVQERKNSQVM